MARLLGYAVLPVRFLEDTLMATKAQSAKLLRDALAKAFPTLTGPQITGLAKVPRAISFTTGETVLREGAAANAFYVVVDGEAEALQQDNHGNQVSIRRMRAGSFFGEVAMLAEPKRTATVRARTPLELLALDRDQFEGLLVDSEAAAATVKKVAARRVAADIAPQRVAAKAGARRNKAAPK